MNESSIIWYIMNKDDIYMIIWWNEWNIMINDNKWMNNEWIYE